MIEQVRVIIKEWLCTCNKQVLHVVFDKLIEIKLTYQTCYRLISLFNCKSMWNLLKGVMWIRENGTKLILSKAYFLEKVRNSIIRCWKGHAITEHNIIQLLIKSMLKEIIHPKHWFYISDWQNIQHIAIHICFSETDPIYTLTLHWSSLISLMNCLITRDRGNTCNIFTGDDL